MTKTSRPPNSMQISFCHFREIEIDHNIHSLYINTARKQIGADQISAESLTEIVEHPISVRLCHFRMYIVATITQFGNLFGQ